MYKNILSYLEQTALAYPNKTAFADENTAITFHDLQMQAQRIGTVLSKSIAARNPVALFMEKGVSAMAGFMGAVYAGCFYVMLDTKHPINRIDAILKILDSKILLTDEKHYEQAKTLGFDGKILRIEELVAEETDEIRLSEIRTQMLDIDPLYAIFTSGSTGVPKGVVVSHRSTIDFIDCFTQTFHITSTEIIGNQAPFDFDVSVKDIYSGLATGATVQIIPRSYFSFPTKLMDFLCERNVTTLIWAVSALCFVTTMKGLEYKLPDKITKIMFSGEVMPIKHLHILQSFLPHAQYINLYGPTEITCNCTYYIVDKEFSDNESLPIGKPFANEKVFLLDEDNAAVRKSGDLGEICVSGTALSLGYYNDTERTQQSFMQNPLHSNYLEPIYRTGDLGKYDADGLLYYVGRKDFQVKHMGHRIELGEIETTMNALNHVNRSCCVYWHEKQRILCFFEGTATKKEIMNSLKKDLPQFMLPNAIVSVSALPITKNGKIDRVALLNSYLESEGKL